MSAPPSPSGGSTVLPSDSSAPSSSKPRRTVRLFSHLPDDGSSSDEEDGAIGNRSREIDGSGIVDETSHGHARQASLNVMNSSGRMRSSTGAQGRPIPKLVRAATSGQLLSSSRYSGATNGSGGILSSTAPAPSIMGGQSEQKTRYSLLRNPSSMSSGSGSTSGSVGHREDPTGGNVYRQSGFDPMDPDSHYMDYNTRHHGYNDLASDEEEELLDGVTTAGSPGEGGLSISPTPGVVGMEQAILPPLITTIPQNPSPTPILPPPIQNLDPSSIHDRKGWQSFLASVLSGDVLQGEAVRIGEERGVDEAFRQDLGRTLWWQIRAKIRRRGEEDNRRRVIEKRNKVVDAVLEEVERFTVKPSPGPPGLGRRLSSESSGHNTPDDKVDPAQRSEFGALDQVNYLLQKLSLVESLYPHSKALREAKPLYATDAFQDKVDALHSWATVVTSLQAQLAILQKWTGSDELDITKPNTTQEKALVGKNRYHSNTRKQSMQVDGAVGEQVADDSTFLERVLKEYSLSQTFERRQFHDLYRLVDTAKFTVISYLPQFHELQLPDFTYELVRLIGFPGRLIVEILKVRLDAASKLIDPNPMVIDDNIDSFRLMIRLMVEIKQRYHSIIASDIDNRWVIPPCLPEEYDEILLSGLRQFFKLLGFKLNRAQRGTYFRETDILEDEWAFLYAAAEATKGGDQIVAEFFCSLTHKLINRVSKYFDRQLHVPVALDPNADPKERGKKALNDIRRLHQEPHTKDEKTPMTPEEMQVWYAKILDAVRMRYRRLQRFGRRLTTRFDNSAEYVLEPEDVADFFDQMEDTHFLVWTKVYEDQGVYVLAHNSLRQKPESVCEIMEKAFSVTIPSVRPSVSRRPSDYREQPIDETMPEPNAIDQDDDFDTEHMLAGYVLLVSPRERFAWKGAVMRLDEFKYIDMALHENRVRLVADGPTMRLASCKRSFSDALNDEEGRPLFHLECVVESQAHLPRIQRQLKRIATQNYHLTESFIKSAAYVRQILGSAPGSQDLTESWFQFASEHGRRFSHHVEPNVQAKFHRLLMRLAISWCSFISDSCDPTQRKTFRWTVQALRTTFQITDGDNILQLDAEEFELLKKSVASLISLLISHFDILGARGTMEAKRESEKTEAMRRLQRAQENLDHLLEPIGPTQSGEPRVSVDRSIRLIQEDRLRLIAELENQRMGLTSDQRLMGQVLDEKVTEDRALVFLAASKSNIALRWQQGQYIGGGANGNVYIGFNLDSGGVMAVKEIRVQDLSNSPALYKQIKDESDVMSMLSHPNIVEYYGIEVHRDRVFIFQEYCEGGSLANQLEHGRVEDEDVVIIYALQMLQGLQYLHERGVEHRDVKPENILIGVNSTLKFGDFGAAKVIVKGNRTMAKTRAMKSKAPADGAGPAVMNSLAGTPMYMAPEVIRPKEAAGNLGSADIWSMGCVLLEICTGRKPWSNLDNEWAIMFHIGIATQHPPLPEKGELSPAGISFIERCLSIDPSERPTATELMGDPWLQPMIQQLMMGSTEEYDYTSSGGAPSATTTMVNSSDGSSVYANQMVEMVKHTHELNLTPGEDMSPLASTPLEPTPDPTPPPPTPPAE